MRIVIADNNELDVLGLQSLCHQLQPESDIVLCKRASQLNRLKQRPDVVLMDFTAEGFSLGSIQRLRMRWPHLPIVAVTALQSSVIIMAAVKAGLTGYVKKDCSVQEIQQSIMLCAQGRPFYCGEILRLLDREAIELMQLESIDLDCEPILLTDRENEILKYIAGGYTNAEIADILFLSSHTVNTHRKNILGKIGVSNAAGAVIYAVKQGLIEPERYTFVRNLPRHSS